MKYFVLFTEEAKRDLGQIESFIPNPNSSLKYIQKILQKVEQLENFPFLGLEIKNNILDIYQIRYLIVGNHIVYYKINEVAKCIYIYGIVSQSSNWKTIVNKNYVSPSIVIAKDETLTIKTMDTSMYYDVWRNSLDIDNRKYVPDEVFETLEEASEVVNFIIESYKSEEGPFIYAIIRNEDQANIGYVQLVKIDLGYEIGYHIAKRYTGHGYAAESVKLFLEYLRNNTKLKEIYGIALSANKASVRVLEKCGFTKFFEGIDLYQGKKRKIAKTIKKI